MGEVKNPFEILAKGGNLLVWRLQHKVPQSIAVHTYTDLRSPSEVALTRYGWGQVERCEKTIPERSRELAFLSVEIARARLDMNWILVRELTARWKTANWRLPGEPLEQETT